jgi:hypothetical protein
LLPLQKEENLFRLHLSFYEILKYRKPEIFTVVTNC